MPKELLRKQLVKIDLHKQDFRFYYVEVLSVGYNQLQVIVTHGKLGTKGKENVTRFVPTPEQPDIFKDAMKFAYSKIYDKKGEGFANLDKMKQWIEQYFVEERKKEQKPVSKKSFTKPVTQCKCDLCGQSIEPPIYKKINDWARGEGNWDIDTNFVGYNKVICINCQIERDMFKKKIGGK
jgi:predicted DNA-binding WGR domain protein